MTMTTLEKQQEKLNRKEKIDKRFGHEIIRRLKHDYASLNQKEMIKK